MNKIHINSSPSVKNLSILYLLKYHHIFQECETKITTEINKNIHKAAILFYILYSVSTILFHI